MKNELLYCGIEILVDCSYSSFFMFIFFLFHTIRLKICVIVFSETIQA